MVLTFIEIVRIVVTLMPEIMKLIKQIEEMMPEGGRGEYKLSLVRAALEAAYNAATDTYVDFKAIWPVVNTIINRLVLIYNTTGAFKK